MNICGRPTKRDTPCTRILQPWEVACNWHATPDEQERSYQRLKAEQEARALRPVTEDIATGGAL
jgi:hypothetical protein